MRSAFHLMDKNGDGALTKEEMLGTIRSDPLVRAVLNTSSVLRPLLHPSTFMATRQSILFIACVVLQEEIQVTQLCGEH